MWHLIWRSVMWPWFTLSIIVVVVDRWTKVLATTQLDFGKPLEILPVFNLTLLHNTGAAFSFLSDAGGWQRWLFTGIAIVASGILAVWLLRLPRTDRLLAASLGLILGGALGNLWDRLDYGYVVDFISVHYQNHYFPAFNIADSAITLGAILLIADTFLKSYRERKELSE